MTGIYVHIPFCRSRCVYCGFASTTLGPTWQESYITALEQEVRERCCENGDPDASTVYIGGGTPSMLSPRHLQRLFRLLDDCFRIPLGTEYTLEVNPDDVSPQFIASLRDTPVNRISMGAQTLSDDLLRLLGRRHTASQVLSSVSDFQSAGYTNINLDLIYGIPHQTLAMFQSDVSRLLATGIPHLSAYALQIEPKTPLEDMLITGELQEADEELSLACYNSLVSLTNEAGMEHYELSNFALPGFQSQHNSSYWTGDPYLGFGAGAHSYNGLRTRSSNTSNVISYINGVSALQREVLSNAELYDETVMLALRTRHGLPLSKIRKRFGERMLTYLLRQATPHIQRGALIHEDDTLRLSPDSLFVSNDIISDLLYVE